MNVYTHDFIVQKDAIDFNGHVNNTMYVKWMQDIAELHSTTVGDTIEFQKEQNIMWVIKSHNIEYFYPAYENDKIFIKTWVEKYKKSASVRKYEFVNEKDDILVKAQTIFVCLNPSTLRPSKIPEDIEKLYL